MFYKLISETQIRKAKLPIKTDDKILFSSDVDELAGYGIYPLIEMPMPTEEGFTATPKYRLEDKIIIKEWELVPLPDEIDFEQAYNELTDVLDDDPES